MREQGSRHTRERTLAKLWESLASARNDIPAVVIPNPCKGEESLRREQGLETYKGENPI